MIYSQEDSTSRTPPIPTTGVDFKNDFPFDVNVEIMTGTMTGNVIYVSHTGTVQTGKDARTFFAGATYFVPKGQAIRLPWTGGTPTWRWMAVY